MTSEEKVTALIKKGVRINNPHSVYIDDTVDPDRITGRDITIHAGCKLFGKTTLILDLAEIGREGPVTIEDCQIGPKVCLNGGAFTKAVFLEGARFGSGAHVREGTILEEGASGAHTVGLKQTILFPFVTLGSLINFCDCFMAGGTGPKDHSEVGSSFIHFNFTPNQDKATPSMMGDVPGGVMLDRQPIFLGGQGGIVGPCRLNYGTVTAAGTICRKDELRENRLIFESPNRNINIQRTAGLYPNFKKIVISNLYYIGNMMALGRWYVHVRHRFVSDAFPQPLLTGLQTALKSGSQTRIDQLEKMRNKIVEANPKLGQSDASGFQGDFCGKWQEIKDLLAQYGQNEGDLRLRDGFLKELESQIDAQGKAYIKTIQNLPLGAKQAGSRWLQSIVDQLILDAKKIMPSYQ